MNIIVSYRGPAKQVPGQPAPGGVQAGLDGLFRSSAPGEVAWVYFNGNQLEIRVSGSEKVEVLTAVPKELIDGHYLGLSNRVLWPVCHDLPIYAAPTGIDDYVQLNFIVASQLALIAKNGDHFAVQDYQFALVPSLLRESASFASITISLFWHIPWPQAIADDHLPIMKLVAKGLLGADLVGFHTEEYRTDFLKFAKTLKKISTRGNTAMISDRRGCKRYCHVTVQPLGIDADYWAELGREPVNVPGLPNVPFVLSAERMDYTKGGYDRFQAIDLFFQTYPEWVGRVTFVQLSGRTRAGIPAFEQYWQWCQGLYDRINTKWGNADWQPIVWLQEPIPSAALAPLYRAASVIAVGPHRDGLNLVASEAVAAASHEQPVALALSRGAGVWHQLGEHAVELHPHAPNRMADAFHEALKMSHEERRHRLTHLQGKVKQNPQSKWVETFCLPPAIVNHPGTRSSRVPAYRTRQRANTGDSTRIGA